MRCSSAVIADEIPADEVGVAAVIGIAERPLDGVGAHEVEERGGVGRKPGGDVLLEVREHRVLLLRGKLHEGRTFGGLRVGVERRKPRGVGAARAAQRAGERAVDVMRRARFRRAGAVGVARDQARDDCLERVGFGGGQRFQRLESRRLRAWRWRRRRCNGLRRHQRRGCCGQGGRGAGRLLE
jgi:hypothetical protein